MTNILNSPASFGWLSILLHWLMALAVFGLFGLGIFMVGLDYYSPWYNRAPLWHEGIGIIFAALMITRLGLRFANPPPTPLANLARAEKHLASGMHWLLIALMIVLVISGYLVSSAGERDIPVFGWFTLPAFGQAMENQQDIAGVWHAWAAWTLIALSVLHAMAAFKHHLINKDSTLIRMLKPTKTHKNRAPR